jgi:hypothetical protein
MKFGARLTAEAYPPWRDGYFRYEEMKKGVEQQNSTTAPPEIKFSEALRAEVMRVEQYARNLKQEILARIQELEERWQTIESWKLSDFPDVDSQVENAKQEAEAAAVDVERLLQFISLNIIGVRKIAKKHDRVTGENAGPMLLSKLQRDAEWSYLDKLSQLDELETMIQRVNMLITKIDAITKMSREKALLHRQVLSSNSNGGGIVSAYRTPTSILDPFHGRISSGGGRSSYNTMITPTNHHHHHGDKSTMSDSSESLSGLPTEEMARAAALTDTNWSILLAKPLLISTETLPVGGEASPILAFCGSLLAGMSCGSIMAALQAATNSANSLSSDPSTTITTSHESTISSTSAHNIRNACVMGLIALGSLTGSRPQLSELYGTVLTGCGFLSLIAFSFTQKIPYPINLSLGVEAWLLGVFIGAWSTQIPRQLVILGSTESFNAAVVAQAPAWGLFMGSLLAYWECTSSGNSPTWTIRILGIMCLITAGFISNLNDANNKNTIRRASRFYSESGMGGNDSGSNNELQELVLEPVTTSTTTTTIQQQKLSTQPTPTTRWTAKSSDRAAAWAALACFGLVRWSRCVVTIAIVGNSSPNIPLFIYFFLSAISSFVAAVVPPWMCSLFGGLNLFYAGVGPLSYLWLEASVRADLSTVPPDFAPTSDNVLALADVLAAITFFAIVMTPEVESYSDVVSVVAAGLMALVSFGRVVAAWL